MTKMKPEESNFHLAQEGRSKKGMTFIFMRWLFVAGMVPFFFLVPVDDRLSIAFVETLAITVVYNILVTLYFKNNTEKKKDISSVTAYLDIILLSILSFQSCGVKSDIFIFYLFLVCYWGLRSETFKTIRISVFCIIAYTISSVCAGRTFPNEFNALTLLIRDIFILLSTLGICSINSEVKKFDEMHKKEFKLARTDKLTGLANRHYFDQKLVEEVEYSNNTGNPLNVLIFDLDNFKKFNDSYGHIWGDKLLTLFSDIIKQNIRKNDIPVRFGGEEFLLLIRDLDSFMAKSVGDRIRRQLEKQKIYIGSDEERKRVTVSCGVAQFPRHSKNIKEVIDMADKALYRAKETGKNVVVSYDEMDIEQ